MKKTVIIFLIVFGLLGALWIIGRLTNMFQFFSTSTLSNYPTFKIGDRFFASKLLKPKRYDFICYYAETPEFGKQIWTHRLCGIEGDTIEIKNGNLLVNHVYADSNLTLAHDYLLNHDELTKLKMVEKISDASVQQISNDSFITYASDRAIKSHSIKAVRQIIPKDYKDQDIVSVYGCQWNQDNFGPVIVPKGKYFVLGDNRLYSRDSRYLGFTEQANYVATVLGHQ